MKIRKKNDILDHYFCLFVCFFFYIEEKVGGGGIAFLMPLFINLSEFDNAVLFWPLEIVWFRKCWCDFVHTDIETRTASLGFIFPWVYFRTLNFYLGILGSWRFPVSVLCCLVLLSLHFKSLALWGILFTFTCTVYFFFFFLYAQAKQSFNLYLRKNSAKSSRTLKTLNCRSDFSS